VKLPCNSFVKITPKYFTSCTKGIFRLLKVRWAPTGLRLWDIDGLCRVFVDFMFQRSHDSTELRPLCALWEHKPPCHPSHICKCHQQIGLEKHLGQGGIIYIQIIQRVGWGGTWWHPWLYFCGCRHFAFDRNFEISLGKKGVNKCVLLVENCNLCNLYNKPAYRVAFSRFKNTANVDMLLLKFKVSWSVSLIHWMSCCDVHGNQTDLH
jgi:hypothetical protein